MNLAQATSTTVNNGDSGLLLVMYFIIAVAFVAGLWKTFVKAKRPGWGAIVPIYNAYLIIKIAGRPGWWWFLYLLPIVNVIIHIIVSLDVAKAFKKSAAFGLFGLWLFPVIGYMILGFGDAKFKGSPKH